MNVSVLASALLAAAWVKGDALGAEGGKAPDPRGCAPLPPWAWQLLMRLSDFKQVLPGVLTAFGAASVLGLLSTAVTLGIPWAEEASDEDSWLGAGASELGLERRWALLLALAFWRAEKMESLLQRTQRACMHAKVVGLGPGIRNGLADPIGWLWPAFWGISRRLALVVVSSFGCSSFLLVVFPAVVFDEFSWWAVAEAQNWWLRRGNTLSPVVDISCQVLDQLHFVPVITRVFFLAVWEYPEVDALLTVCALMWTGHNCHTIYNAFVNELPASARKLFSRSVDE